MRKPKIYSRLWALANFRNGGNPLYLPYLILHFRIFNLALASLVSASLRRDIYYFFIPHSSL
mgnify:CR=1 FL=1